MYVRKTGFPGCDTLRHYSRRYIYHFTDHFCSYNRVDLVPLDLKEAYVSGEKAEVTLEFQNTSEDTICFGCNCSHTPVIKYAFYFEDPAVQRRTYTAGSSGAMPDLLPYATGRYKVVIQVPDVPGEAGIQFSFGSRDLYPGINSRPVQLNILPRAVQRDRPPPPQILLIKRTSPVRAQCLYTSHPTWNPRLR